MFIPVTDARAKIHKREENVPVTLFYNASRITTVVLVEGLVLSYPLPNALSEAVAEKAEFSVWKIADFSFT